MELWGTFYLKVRENKVTKPSQKWSPVGCGVFQWLLLCVYRFAVFSNFLEHSCMTYVGCCFFFKIAFWCRSFLKSILNLLQYCFCCLCSGFVASRHVGSQGPDQGSNPHPLHWQVKSNHWTTREVPISPLLEPELGTWLALCTRLLCPVSLGPQEAFHTSPPRCHWNRPELACGRTNAHVAQLSRHPSRQQPPDMQMRPS